MARVGQTPRALTAPPASHPAPRSPPAAQARLPAERAQQWVAFWMLTGSETLCVSAIGFPVSLPCWPVLRRAAVAPRARAAPLLGPGRAPRYPPTPSSSLIRMRPSPPHLPAPSPQVRLHLHLPLQLVAMGLSSWNLPAMCADVSWGCGLAA